MYNKVQGAGLASHALYGGNSECYGSGLRNA